MKRLCSMAAAVIITAVICGQAPNSIKYQAVLRDASGIVRSNTNVSIDVAILQESATGAEIYTENHNVKTNEFGLINLEIGSKNPTGFSLIDWSEGPYFIKISVDNTEMGTSQLLSVPYALYAKTAENGFSGDYNDLDNKPDFAGWDDNKSDDVHITKNYVDSLLNILGIIPKNFADIVKDVEGNEYKTIKIDGQVWMAENLRTTTYNDGTPILLVEDSIEWINNSNPSYCWYKNDRDKYGSVYGALYTYEVVMTNKLCPAGWHVSTSNDFFLLENNSGGKNFAGGKLKEAGTIHWNTPNIGATNEVGFSALPGGTRYHDYLYTSNDLEQFTGGGNVGYWWSPDENTRWFRGISNSEIKLGLYYVQDSKRACSVRCVKD